CACPHAVIIRKIFEKAMTNLFRRPPCSKFLGHVVSQTTFGGQFACTHSGTPCRSESMCCIRQIPNRGGSVACQLPTDRRGGSPQGSPDRSDRLPLALEIMDLFAFDQAEIASIDGRLKARKIDWSASGIGVSWILHSPEYCSTVIPHDTSVRVDAPSGDLGNTFVPILCLAFVNPHAFGG